MSNSHFDFLERLERTKSQMDQQAAAVLQSTAELSESAMARLQSVLDAVAVQNGVIERNGEVLRELSQASQHALQLNASMNDSMATLAAMNLGERARELLEAMEIQKQEIAASVSALTRTAEITNEVLLAQSRLNDSVTKLHETKFDDTLSAFRDSLVGLKPVLENLREPFILQAVPISREVATKDNGQ